MAEDSGFLRRWSQRKAAVRQGQVPASEPTPAPEPATPVAVLPGGLPPAQPPQPTDVPADASTAAAQPQAPALSLEDVAQLTRESDFSAFVAPEVPSDVKNAALKKLFSNPHFNVMDGLDTYIEDYGQPDPLPPGMLRQLVQSKMLGLFDDDPEKEEEAEGPGPAEAPKTAAVAAPAEPTLLPEPAPLAPPHEDADLQLQPDPAAGRAGPEGRVGEDQCGGPARQH